MAAKLRALIAAFLACSAGCAENHSVSAKDYPRGCTSSGDCVAVYEGVIDCCEDGCPNAAIHGSALQQYTKDFAQSVPMCNPPPSCPAQHCQSGRAACISGLCTFEATDSGVD